MTNDDKVRFTFRLKKSLLEEIKKVAKSMNVSTNSLIIEILWQHLEKTKIKGE